MLAGFTFCDAMSQNFDGKSFIEFVPRAEISSVSFDVIVSLRGRRVDCDCLAIEEPKAFLSELRHVVRNGSGAAKLHGTCDFSMTVEAINLSAYSVSFSVSDFIETIPVPMKHVLEGGFVVEEAPAKDLYATFKNALCPEDFSL